MIKIVDGTVQKRQHARPRNGSTQQPNFFFTDMHFSYLGSKSNLKIFLTHFKNGAAAHAHNGHLRGPILFLQVDIISFITLLFFTLLLTHYKVFYT